MPRKRSIAIGATVVALTFFTGVGIGASGSRAAPAAIIPGDGTFRVGTDIAAGEYRSAGSDYCYWSVNVLDLGGIHRHHRQPRWRRTPGHYGLRGRRDVHHLGLRGLNEGVVADLLRASTKVVPEGQGAGLLLSRRSTCLRRFTSARTSARPTLVAGAVVSQGRAVGEKGAARRGRRIWPWR